MKHATVFLALAAVLAWRATSRGGWQWIWIWPAVGFAAVGAAYLGLGAKVLGKRADGTLAWPAVVLLAPYLAGAWCAWRMLRRVRREPCYNELTPGLLIGRRALPHELPANVSLVVDLTAELSEPHGVRQGRSYLSLPTLDGSVAPASELAVAVRTIAGWPGTVFLHCAQGHGRTATVAAAVLLAKGLAHDTSGALVMLRAARPGIVLNRAQRRFLGRMDAARARLGI